mmetsp:Transcript_70999/g.199259  ORF Transcript_70999/g.199259 Transcript_70999/m.199259 type:complete len:212 (-) Transcript_70999:2006-2641(-)
MTFGFGLKKASWLSTSASSCWCESCLRAFMMRTTAASIATDRSSSTRFGLCDSSRLAIGIRILSIFDWNFGAATKRSVTLMVFDFGDFSITLYLPHDSECSTRFKCSSGRLRRSLSCSKLNCSSAAPGLLKARIVIACRVVTCRSYFFLPQLPLTVAFPKPHIHARRRLLFLVMSVVRRKCCRTPSMVKMAMTMALVGFVAQLVTSRRSSL